MTSGLSPKQKQQYARDGFVILPGVFGAAECDEMIRHMMDLHAGQVRFKEFPPREPDNWARTFQQHVWDERALKLLIDPRLRAPLRDAMNGDEPDAVQTMYFFKGSEQRRHQDQYYLPGCMSAWCAMQDVGPDNGTIWVQLGSHKRRLITQADMKDKDGTQLPVFGNHYDDAVDALFAENGLPEVPVEARKGDVVLFHGGLIHRGGPIGTPGSFRHVLANHYIPHSMRDWPHVGWDRIDFDGNRRPVPPPMKAAS